jgi:hypothetical protein
MHVCCPDLLCGAAWYFPGHTAVGMAHIASPMMCPIQLLSSVPCLQHVSCAGAKSRVVCVRIGTTLYSPARCSLGQLVDLFWLFVPHMLMNACLLDALASTCKILATECPLQQGKCNPHTLWRTRRRTALSPCRVLCSLPLRETTVACQNWQFWAQWLGTACQGRVRFVLAGVVATTACQAHSTALC